MAKYWILALVIFVTFSYICLQDFESFVSSDVETIHAALLKVFRDLKQAERYEVVNPSVLKHMFAKHQESFWGCMQQVVFDPLFTHSNPNVWLND